jgi:hypothetical protein
MAVAPLFVTDTETLKSKLRLKGVALTDAGQPLIEEAIQQVRAEFGTRLGLARISEIQALTFVENPTTADGYTRALANSLEVKMVRLRLMRILPTMFMDGSGDAHDVWNEEAPFRETSQFDLRAEMNMLEEEINSDLGILSGADEDGSPNRSALIGPTEAQPLPFGTIWPPNTV